MVELPVWGLIVIGAVSFVVGCLFTLGWVLVVTGKPEG